MTNAVAEVLSGERRWACVTSDAVAFLRDLPDDSVSLTFFSPPYEAQRSYGIGFRATGERWVHWMRGIVLEACRVTDGLVCVNAAGPVEDGVYSPTMELLVADLTRLDGIVCGPAPWCWWKVCGIPGSGARRYQRRDWEPVYGFAKPDSCPPKWTDNTAFGHPPKYGAGGEFSNRNKSGIRAGNVWKMAEGGRRPGRETDGKKKSRHTKRVATADGDTMRDQHYAPPDVCDPGNVIEGRVGGGHLGHPLAHEGEAPMPVQVAERFVCWYAPPDSVVCDPFTGTGTTCDAAFRHGRRFVGCDLRQSQVELCQRRIETVTPSLFSEAAP